MDLLFPFDQMQSAVCQLDLLEGTTHGQLLRIAVTLRTIQVLVLTAQVVTPTPLPPPLKVLTQDGKEDILPLQILLHQTQLLLGQVDRHTDLMQSWEVELTDTVLSQQEVAVKIVLHQEVLN